MAKRESQGLQIALILTVMLAVLMAITTIVFWNMAKKGNAELASLRSENQTSQTRLRDTVDQNQALKEMLGYTADENIETVKEEFELAKQKFGANFPEENRNYRKLPEFMANTINDLHTKIAETDARLRELEQKNTNLIEEKNKLVAIEKDAHDKAAQEVLNLRAKFAADLKKLTDKMESWELADKKKLREKDSRIASLDKNNGELKSRLATKDKLNERLAKDKRALQTETFETPDGRIVWVNQRLRTVLLNLGAADSLRKQITFSVYDVDSNNLASSKSKGKIEVIRIIDDHQAEARILDDSPSNPITSNDIVYSPIWEVGNPVRFALTGFMDIDHDGETDRALIRRLITLSGGVVDAEVADDGKRSGEISVYTRYLVTGDQPTDKTSDAVRSSDTQIRNEAKDAGVTLISLDRLLSDIGYQQISKSVALGENARSVDFPAKRYEGTHRFAPRPRPVSSIKKPVRKN
jgi:flagellar basal body-associated protein FliL